MARSEATAEGAAPIDRKKLGQVVLVLKAAARSAPIRQVCIRLCRKSASSPTG